MKKISNNEKIIFTVCLIGFCLVIVIPWFDSCLLKLIGHSIILLIFTFLFFYLGLNPNISHTRPDHRNAPPESKKLLKRINIGCHMFFTILGLIMLWVMTIPFARNIIQFVENDCQYDRVVGTVERNSASFPASMAMRHLKISGSQDITILYPSKRYKIGSQYEFYLLPGTKYALDGILKNEEVNKL